MVNVLIVDDEVNIRTGLREVLARDGHQIRDAENGEAALAILEGWQCEVVLLDIRMPGLTGIEVLETIHEKWRETSVVILTGHGTLESAMTAIKKGAQDYLLKPARPGAIRKTVSEAARRSMRKREEHRLIETLRTGLDRLDDFSGHIAPPGQAPPAGPGEVRRVGELSVDFTRRQVQISGKTILLSPTEYQLLAALASSPGHTLDYLSLAETGLGYSLEAAEAKDLIKRHIFAIRKKLEFSPAARGLIENVRGFGYRLSASRPEH